MIGQGRNEGGYRCGNALSGECWNRATVARNLAVDRIFGAVSDRLLRLDGAADTLVAMVGSLLREDGDAAKRMAVVKKRLAQLAIEIDNYVEAIGKLGMASIEEKLGQREAEQRHLQEELAFLENQVWQRAALPTREEILTRAQEAGNAAMADDDEAGVLLRQLTTPIIAVPYQRIDCGLVVLRARFQLNLVALLPDQWRQVVRGVDMDLDEAQLHGEPIEIDLFDEPAPVRLAKQALAPLPPDAQANRRPDRRTSGLKPSLGLRRCQDRGDDGIGRPR